jgi:hypothetical protein
VAARARKARAVAQHIRDLARTVDGPTASSLRKAVITYVIPSLLYGTKAWYVGRTKPPKHPGGDPVSAQNGWHVKTIDKSLALAVRGVLLV